MPDNNGIHDLFDMTNITMVYREGRVYISGNSACKWEGVEPTDRITSRGELLKFQQGDWQPTPISASTDDFCAIQFVPTSLTYPVWGRHINREDRKCVNNFGVS
ncbi:uncharacterized protein LOC131806390 [Musca domestica]|uniref:Uncharacterized protein LOC131806390 n=1 Tax=Musca domestica TaxID=7370 RepID=A0ABM3VKV7_MUSDO|nr:uncharacterized protein LOC131806390 [Musca domestica]